MALISGCSESLKGILSSPPYLYLNQCGPWVEPDPQQARDSGKHNLQRLRSHPKCIVEYRVEKELGTEACGQCMPKPWANLKHLTWMFIPS